MQVRGFKHEAPTIDETHCVHCSEKSAAFSPKEEATSLNNVTGQK